MRILVAGWHGQIAFALSGAAARRDDIEAYAVGRPALDLADHPSVGRGLFGIAPDVIINTAAYTDVDGAELNPEAAFKRNEFGAAALASQAARINVPIIHLSTVYVFDGEKPGPYVEADPTNPINAYGRSKRAAEAAVAVANPKHIILRTGWIYSPFGRNFIASMIARSQTEPELHVDNVQCGSPTFAPNLAHAILDIAAKITMAPSDAWGTYHIADHGTASWYDLARQAVHAPPGKSAMVPAMRHKAPPIIHAIAAQQAEKGAPRPRNATLDCTKLHRTFGIQLPAWQLGVATCVRQLNNATS